MAAPGVKSPSNVTVPSEPKFAITRTPLTPPTLPLPATRKIFPGPTSTRPIPNGVPELAVTCNAPASTFVPPVYVFDVPEIRSTPVPVLVNANPFPPSVTTPANSIACGWPNVGENTFAAPRNVVVPATSNR
jgi:hypothetical protein